MTPGEPELYEPHLENPYIKLVSGQNIVIIPEFTLETGMTLKKVPVGYKTWGKLNDAADNVMVICHALSGSADVEDWWGPLIGPNKAFDTTRFFIFCANVLGSPYGTGSPVTINPETGKKYGPEFPLTSIRDDVNLHRIVLDSLKVKQVAIVIGGSLGGMQVLEWAFFGPEYVKSIVPIATSGRHSAWGISWGEAQRQSIYSDPNYRDGYYTQDAPPNIGLAAARMSALLTYRSRNSFESRFGRKVADKYIVKSPPQLPTSNAEVAVWIHNDGHKNSSIYKASEEIMESASQIGNSRKCLQPGNTISSQETPTINTAATANMPFVFSAQSYLRYQGDKFVNRFDANCYIALTRKMDVHDVARGRDEFEKALATIIQPSLVIGIESDGLFNISEQYELAHHIPNAEMVVIQSPDGHDGFLLEFDQINKHILGFIKRVLPDIYNRSPKLRQKGEAEEELKATKTSLFGEAEVDVMTW